MAVRYIKAVGWFIGFTGLGYVLQNSFTLSDEQMKELKPNLPGIEKSPKEVLSRNQQFLNVLKAAADSPEPLYRVDRDIAERELRKKP